MAIGLILCLRTTCAGEELESRITVQRDREALRVEVAGVISAETGTIIHAVLTFEGTELVDGAGVVREKTFSVALRTRGAFLDGIYRVRLRAGAATSELTTFVGDPEEWIAARTRRIGLVKELALVVSAAASNVSRPRSWYDCEDRLRRELTPATPGVDALTRLVDASERLRSSSDSGREQAAAEARARIASAERAVGAGEAGATHVLLERSRGLELAAMKPWACALEVEAALLEREVRTREEAVCLARAIQAAANAASRSDARAFADAQDASRRARERVEHLARARAARLVALLEHVALPTDARIDERLRGEIDAAGDDPYLVAVAPDVRVDVAVLEKCLLFRAPCRGELLAQLEAAWQGAVERLRSAGRSP